MDFALGGPIKKDKLWFFYLGRTYGNGTSVTGIFANQNAGNPNAWSYLPDPALQARNDSSTIANSLRMTWQMSQKNKLNLFWDSQRGCNGAAWIGSGAEACRKTPDGWIVGGTSSPFRSRLKAACTATPRRSASSRRPGPTRCRARCSSSSATAGTTAAGADR